MNSDALYRLVYYSRSAIPPNDEALEAGIRQILTASRRNNDRVAVGGALMFNSGCFAQVLEGPQKAVEETFERIQRDPRHSDVLVLEYKPTDSRTFPSWSMAFVGENTSDRARFGEIAGESGFDPAHMDAEQIFATLRRLVIEEERAA